MSVPPASAEALAPIDSEARPREMKSVLSVAAGLLLLVAALFPRSIKQLLLLASGAYLVRFGWTQADGASRTE